MTQEQTANKNEGETTGVILMLGLVRDSMALASVGGFVCMVCAMAHLIR
ncbi:MAG: cell division inhibitor SidA [Caulobacteraceae bacterium]